jgi:hypothetical protein
MSKRMPDIKSSEDYVPLRKGMGEYDKRILLETHFGYTEKGYPEMCRYCNGHFGINVNGVVPGEQV